MAGGWTEAERALREFRSWVTNTLCNERVYTDAEFAILRRIRDELGARILAAGSPSDGAHIQGPVRETAVVRGKDGHEVRHPAEPYLRTGPSPEVASVRGCLNCGHPAATYADGCRVCGFAVPPVSTVDGV